MIVKDEESRLAKCLNSAKNLIDEIIIVDTGSEDKTIEIAQSFGARVESYGWNHDFSVARNEALKYATGDWILVLDADEVLSPKIIPHIQEVMKMDDYILINLLRQEIGAHQSPYSLVSRLFRRHPEISFTRPYHAIVDDSISEILHKEPYWQIGHLTEVGILHDGYQKDIINQQDKFAKAQVAMENFIANNHHDPYVCSKLGALYIESGRVNDGIQLLLRGIASKQANSDLMYELHYHLGIGYTHAQNIKQALIHYQAATKLVVFPMLKLGAYNNLGSLFKEAGDLKNAKMAYSMTIRIDPNFAAGHYNLGLVLKAMGLFVDAIASYQKAIQLNPNYADAYQNLGVAWLKIGNVKAALPAFNKAISLHETHNPNEAVRLRQGLQEMGFLK
ncbi:glycosyltransferase [Calothrix sp. PCC 6303]|uniref:glycosyltransferase n=1 Tax=Calothrix sp. PCC 6303 TaxID=1170562 RepID=UPI0002A02C84|nr:glycosyltransferase [Calothrix sp. PCC 6303]AFY99182.1 glycosyl transferase family 2 [Calothrix sp. PCC 6303]